MLHRNQKPFEKKFLATHKNAFLKCGKYSTALLTAISEFYDEFITLKYIPPTISFAMFAECQRIQNAQ